MSVETMTTEKLSEMDPQELKRLISDVEMRIAYKDLHGSREIFDRLSPFGTLFKELEDEGKIRFLDTELKNKIISNENFGNQDIAREKKIKSLSFISIHSYYKIAHLMKRLDIDTCGNGTSFFYFDFNKRFIYAAGLGRKDRLFDYISEKGKPFRVVNDEDLENNYAFRGALGAIRKALASLECMHEIAVLENEYGYHDGEEFIVDDVEERCEDWERESFKNLRKAQAFFEMIFPGLDVFGLSPQDY